MKLGINRFVELSHERPTMVAGTVLPTQPPPKVVNKQQTLPSYLTTATPSTETPLLRKDRLLANTDITTYRQGADSRVMLRDFTRSSPDLSAAVTSYIRAGITSGYTAIARNPDGTVNPEATSTLAQIITRMNILNDYSIGFDDSLSLRSLSEVWARELVTYGACAGELVLDKTRLPSYIHPVTTTQIRMFPSSDAKKLVPKQFLAGDYISLDIPTFFMVRLDEDLLDPYPVSPIEPAIQATIFSVDFMNDIRKVVKRAIHPRMVVTIDEEKFRKSIPQEYLNDAVKLKAYMDAVVSDIERKVNNLKPEDAVVTFDTITISIEDHGNTNLAGEYETLQVMIDGKMSSGTKVLPTILGQSDGTANTASAEVLIWMKMVEGTVWGKLNEMYSKAFTLAVRLLGHDVYVEFQYNAIDLRPEGELEAFRAMKQARVLEQLSLGLLTDEDAAIQLTGHLPPAGMKPLSGTQFYNAKVAPAGDGFNGASNKGSTLNQKSSSSAPKGIKSKKGTKAQPGKKAEAEIIPLTAVK